MLALRVAARWQRRLADAIGDPHQIIKRFEGVVDALAYMEKDIPAILEMDKLYKKVVTEAKARHVYEEDVWKEYGVDAEDQEDQRPSGRVVMVPSAVRKYKTLLMDFMFKVKFSSDEFQRVEAQNLFLGLLQQYDLPPKVRKAIEAAAKYHASRRKAPAKEDALEAYMKMMGTIRGQLAAAKEALAHGKPRGAGEPGAVQETLRAGPFKVVNTGGFDDKTMAEVQAVVEKSAQLLQARGLGRVCYGDVLVSRTLSRQNVLAFYLVSKDELFVRANLRGKQHDAVQTICHELGHRLHFKFLKDKDRDIRSIYAQIARKTNWVDKKNKIQEVLNDHPVLPGDTFEGKGGKLYEVAGTSWKGKGLVVDLVRKPPASSFSGELPAAPGVVEKAYIPLDSYLINKGLLSSKDLTEFVTNYAAKNHEENFAEMIAEWCLNKLPEDQVELLKAVL